MLPLEIPADTTVESLIRSVVPDLHGRLVPDDAPRDPLPVGVRVEGLGSYAVTIRGRQMQVADGEAERPAVRFFTTARAVERFLEDALGPRRFLPKAPPAGLGVGIVTDPRVVKRVAMASGSIELALRDVDGERVAVVLAFGDAARKDADPEDPDVDP